MLWFVLVAILIQAPVFTYLAQVMNTTSEVRERPLRMRLMAGQMVRQTPPPSPEERLEKPHVVEVAESHMDEPLEPVETRYAADRRTRVKKEQKARRTSPRDSRKVIGRVQVKDPSKIQSRSSDSADPTVTSKDEERLSLVTPRQDRPLARKGTMRPDSVLYQGDKTEILMPTMSKKARLASVQGLSGSFGSDDHLPKVKDEGDSTLLNANKYKYADFFYRVKEMVRRHWHPDRVYRSRDPSGRIYGVKDRYTVLRVTLSKKGYLKRMVTTERSGLDFLDSEARQAFRRAHPFPNPPLGLVSQDEVEFQFGFYFELSTGRHRFRWKRLR